MFLFIVAVVVAASLCIHIRSWRSRSSIVSAVVTGKSTTVWTVAVWSVATIAVVIARSAVVACVYAAARTVIF